MNISYILLRLVRHFLPERITRALLLRGLIIRPGLETRSPKEAAVRYQRDLQTMGIDIQGKDILIFGYGGRFALGCNLLKLGARHVTLCEFAAHPDETANAALLPEFKKYLAHQSDKTFPREEWITLLQGDIRELVFHADIRKADIVCSTSVFEHLTDPDGILDALVNITSPDGIQIHYIDLRDHFFKFPFEMLTYSPVIWKTWLNPTSNLNRWRLPAYEKLFHQRFEQVDVQVFERNLPAWDTISARILPEFITGDPQVDAVTQIRVFAGRKL
ncbi:MAG TPA: methyltransferase domain-containing protein [Leptolinea sp.]